MDPNISVQQAEPVLPKTQVTQSKPKFLKWIIVAILVLLLLVVSGVSAYILVKNSPPKTQLTTTLNGISSMLTHTSPQSLSEDNYSIQPYLDGGNMISACDKSLEKFPSKAVQYISTSNLIDLSMNKLTSLPIDSSWNHLKEINLVSNNFSKKEQETIRKALPNTKIAFVPDNNFDPSVTSNWKTYSDSIGEFSFKYHPELKLDVDKRSISISNDLADLEYSYASCAIGKKISINITTKENPTKLTPREFIEKELGKKIFDEGDIRSMIGPLRQFKSGQLDGIIFQSGEKEHLSVYASHNNIMVIINIFAGGQTGDVFDELTKKIFYNTLSTFSFNN